MHFSDPARARCLKDNPGATRDAPLPPLCQPLVCDHAVMSDEHLVIWRSEGEVLRSLLTDKRLPVLEKARLAPQLKRIDHLTGRSGA